MVCTGVARRSSLRDNRHAMKTLLPVQLLFAPQKSEVQPLVIYHGQGCPDGFAAALAAWIFYDGQAEFVGLDHGQIRALDDLPPLRGRAVYILDFSFPVEILRGIEESAAKLVLLDHHKSAAEQLTGFSCRCGMVHFDMGKSGCRLAWEFFLPERPMPDLLRYIEDRDIWAWRYPESAGFLAALDMEPFDFAHWASIAAFDATQLTGFMARGAAMDEKFNKLAADLAHTAQPIRFNGERGLMVNAPGTFHSAVGDMLSRQSGSFALIWCVSKAGVVKVGLRSQRGYDCIPLARSMGGGGHAQACGFKMGVEHLAELLSGEFHSGANPRH